MGARQDRFRDLMDDPTKTEEIALTVFFLEQTVKAVDGIFKANALQVAADFDDFHRKARDQYGSPFYASFFTTLSEIIKKHHLA